jgi:hypothetical protein
MYRVSNGKQRKNNGIFRLHDIMSVYQRGRTDLDNIQRYPHIQKPRGTLQT